VAADRSNIRLTGWSEFMARLPLLLCALAIGGIAAIIHIDADNAPSLQNEEPATSSLQTSVTSAPIDIDAAPPATIAPQQITQLPPAITAKKIAQWIAETTDEDPAIRASAIDALANAPKSKAMPVLLHVMRSGINEDRQLALDSLHTLALRQGDENDAIRTALRLVIYDGDEEVIISSAQIALEDIEYDLPAPTPDKK